MPRRGLGKARSAGLRNSSGWIALALAGIAAAALPAPAAAQNECGAPPPGGGTVTCPPGNYPNGIDYNVVQDLTVVLQPGVTTGQSVEITSFTAGVDLRLEGATDTDINSSQSGRPGGEGVLLFTSGGSVLVAVDDVTTTADYAYAISARGNGNVVVSGTSLATEGANSDGLVTSSLAGDVSVEIGSIVTDGIRSRGVVASGSASGGAVVVTTGSVITRGFQSDGIIATGSYGDVVVDSGYVSTTGDQAQGIFAETTYGSLSVLSDNVETRGDLACGICAGRSGLGGAEDGDEVSVDSGTVLTGGDNSVGIRAYGRYAAVTVTSGDVRTVGLRSIGIAATGSSKVEIRSDTITTAGDDAVGILANVLEGEVVVTSESVMTSGDRAAGIRAEAFYTTGIPTGDVVIVSGEVTTSGASSPGIAGRLSFLDLCSINPDLCDESPAAPIATAALAGPGVSITSGDVATAGDDSPGIDAYAANGDIEIFSTGAVITSGAESAGILAEAPSGAITVESNAIATTGAYGAGIAAYAGGDVTITSVTVETGGDFGLGIVAIGETGTTSVTSTRVETAGRAAVGIGAINLTGQARVDSEEVVTGGDGAIGIGAVRGNVILGDIGGGGGGGGFGVGVGDPMIVPAAAADGDVVVDSGSVVTGGDGAIGILAVSGTFVLGDPGAGGGGGAGGGSIGDPLLAPAGVPNGDIVVASESVVTGGAGAIGIFAVRGDVFIGGIGGGDGGGGGASVGDELVPAALGAGGSILVTSGSVDTQGYGAVGILADNRGSYGSGGIGGSVVIESETITTRGDFAGGIVALGGTDKYGEAGTVTVTSGTISTSGAYSDAIAASGPGDVAVTSTAITTTGYAADGIDATSISGNVSVTSGAITTDDDYALGIIAGALDGNIDIASTGTIRTAGANATGIYAVGGGIVTIGSSNVVTTGDGATGIFAVQLGEEGDVVMPGGTLVPAALGPNGGISITSGAMATSGPDAPGIDAYAATGDVEVLSTGALATAGANSPGILAESASGFVTVIADAVSTTGTGSDAIAVTAATRNFVTVRGLVQATNGFEVQAEGGPATVTVATTGVVRGAVDLTDGNDSLANGGLFDAIGTSQFGAGTDAFANSGTTRSASGAGVLAGLESFTSSGLVELRDGAPGDSLAVAGAFVGEGGRLGVDVDFGTGTADLLITGAATGTTLVDLNPIGGSSVGFDPIRIVDGGAGTSATAFALASDVNASPFVQLGLQFDAGGNDFLLVAEPDQAVFETALYPEQAINVWYQSARAVAAQLATRRDSVPDQVSYLWSENGFGAWAQLHAGEIERDATQAFGTAPALFDVGYEQQFEGLQGGFDYRFGGALVGLTGGVTDSDADFAASFGRLELDAVNLGAYASYENGDFFFHGLAKIDWLDATSLPGAGLAAEFDGTAFGVSGTAGYRFALGSAFYAEPSISLSWVELDLDDYVIAGAAVAFGDLTSLRGAAGLRVGGDIATTVGIVSPFVGLYAIDEFDGDVRSDFALGATTLALVQEAPGTWGQVQAGISFIAGAFEAFARGEIDFSGDVEGVAGRFGARLRF